MAGPHPAFRGQASHADEVACVCGCNRVLPASAIPRVSHSVSGVVRTFSFLIANRSVGHPRLENIDYSCIFEEPSALEQAYVCHLLEPKYGVQPRLTESTAQYIRSYVENGYVVVPRLEPWEVALY